MKFVADENLHRQIIDELRQAGHEIIAIAEVSPGIVDDDVLALSVRENVPLLTEDKDFGDLVFHQQLPSAGIVLIRISGMPLPQKILHLKQAIQQYGAQFHNAFSVISDRAVRISQTGP